MIIQPLLVLIITIIAMVTLRRMGSAQLSAMKKISVGTLAIFAAIAVLLPNSTNTLARSLGVGRGADLLLYTVTIAFLLYVSGEYSRSRKNKAILNRLARNIAIDTANNKASNKDKLIIKRVARD